MFLLASALLVGLLGGAVALLRVSPGTPAPFLDAAGAPMSGSISEKIQVEINGVRQGMFIKSKNANHPVLLYLHGGIPDYFLTRQYPTGWEDEFTVVWWEQRGSGISYSTELPPEAMTMEQLVAVTTYLRDRFGKDKIYLMGHSGGTFIGIQAVAQAPQLYHAYIGVAQMSYQAESEVLAYEYMLDHFRATRNTRMIAKLEESPVTLVGGIPHAYVAIRDKAMHDLGIGTMRGMRSLLTGLVMPSFLFREYTVAEKVNLWRAKSRSGISAVWDKMVTIDLRKVVTEIATPVYFLQGIHDYTVSYTLARSYFDVLKAPVKGFYTSRHRPIVRCSRTRPG